MPSYTPKYHDHHIYFRRRIHLSMVHVCSLLDKTLAIKHIFLCTYAAYIYNNYSQSIFSCKYRVQYYYHLTKQSTTKPCLYIYIYICISVAVRTQHIFILLQHAEFPKELSVWVIWTVFTARDIMIMMCFCTWHNILHYLIFEQFPQNAYLLPREPLWLFISTCMKSQDHDLFEAIWELIKWPDNMLCVALMRLTPNHLQIIHKFAIIIPWSIWWISWWYLWVAILKWIAHAWLQTRASGQYSSQDHQGDMYHSCTIHSTDSDASAITMVFSGHTC